MTLLEEVLVIRRKNNDPKDLSSVLTALGTTCLKAKFLDKAYDALTESIDIRRDLFANGDKDISDSLVSSLKRLVELYQKIGKKEGLEKIKLEIKKLSTK